LFRPDCTQVCKIQSVWMRPDGWWFNKQIHAHSCCCGDRVFRRLSGGSRIRSADVGPLPYCDTVAVAELAEATNSCAVGACNHYDAAVTWLDRHGFSAASLWADNVSVSRLLGLVQRVTSRLNTTLSFWLITLLYVILGLMEVDDLRRKVEIIIEPGTARNILSASSEAAHKLRKYLRVRTQMSVMTGVLVGLFAWAVGLQFPMEWAVIAFTLNYIPFIGPFVATLLPTVLEMAHATTWQSVVGIFVCLNIIQFAVGSYIEPRLAGAVLSISPTVVLFTTFFWAYIWGIYGAFIGVPLTIAILTFCDHFASTHWIAQLFGGPLGAKDRPSTS
jgi:AI-2 transport protein TqsA